MQASKAYRAALRTVDPLLVDALRNVPSPYREAAMGFPDAARLSLAAERDSRAQYVLEESLRAARGELSPDELAHAAQSAGVRVDVARKAAALHMLALQAAAGNPSAKQAWAYVDAAHAMTTPRAEVGGKLWRKIKKKVVKPVTDFVDDAFDTKALSWAKKIAQNTVLQKALMTLYPYLSPWIAAGGEVVRGSPLDKALRKFGAEGVVLVGKAARIFAGKEGEEWFRELSEHIDPETLKRLEKSTRLAVDAAQEVFKSKGIATFMDGGLTAIRRVAPGVTSLGTLARELSRSPRRELLSATAHGLTPAALRVVLNDPELPRATRDALIAARAVRPVSAWTAVKAARAPTTPTARALPTVSVPPPLPSSAAPTPPVVAVATESFVAQRYPSARTFRVRARDGRLYRAILVPEGKA